MIDLRVGHIIDGILVLSSAYCKSLNDILVKRHPDADGLYVEVPDDLL
jgi:hypothetical protein